MSPHALARRWAIRAGAAAFTATLLSFSLQYATAATAASHARHPLPVSLINRMYSPADPYSPLHNNHYRHGVIPTRAQLVKMRQWALAHPAIHALNASALSFGGGIDGIGVTTGAPKVYLVFWGNQWGTQGTDSNGNLTFSNDPNSAAPYLQNLFKGLGTGNELWSAVMTQYCQGVATGTQTCPSGNTQHVGYPTGGALAGVWYDNSAAEPSAASGHQIGVEAVNAAGHFGNTTAALNRNAQYDIISSTGLNPDNWLTGGFCAWHDYNGDSTLSGGAVTSPYGDISFTNMPYVTDQGTSCGQNFVNSGSAGTDDGFSIVNGHEFAETVTDQNPAGGWTNSSGSENGDLCAWNMGGGAVSGNLSLPTGTFAMQPTWGNDGANGGDCEFSHSIVTNGGGSNTVTVSNPGNQTGTVGTAVSLQMSATDSQSGQTFTWSASGLPAGLSIGSSTGLISGTPTTAATSSVTATATDTTGAHGSASFSWTINSSGGGNGIVNGGFETGNLSGWTASGAATGVTTSGPHSGTYAAMLGSTSPTNGDSSIAQTFTVPSGDGTLAFWYNVTCPDTVTYDWATATLKNNTTGTTTTVLGKTCVSSSGWKQVSTAVIAGDSYTLTLTSHDDNYPADPTYTKYDDVALSAAAPNVITNGGFETGSFSGWTTSGAATSIVSSGAHSGTYAARAGSTSPTNGDSNIAQTFTAGTGDTGLTFWYNVTCPDTLTYDWATATLKNNTTGTTTTVLAKTCVSSSGWTQVNASLIAGDSYTLTLTSHDDNYPADPTYTLFDDVSTH